MDDLVADPANPRHHPEKNKKAVRGSIKRFGAGRSILIDEGNVIVAGNEATNGFAAEGYKEVVIVDLKPGQLLAARRSDMTETEKTAYGIADNKTGDSSFFSDELPAALHSLKVDGFDLSSLGFSDDELKRLMDDEKGSLGVPSGVSPSEPELCSCPKCGHSFPK